MDNKILLEDNSKKYKNTKSKSILKICLLILILIFLILLYIYFSPNINKFVEDVTTKTKHFADNNLFLCFLYVLLIESGFNILNIPGLTFFNIGMGFIFKDNIILSFSLIYFTILISSIISYGIARFALKGFISNLLKNRWFFKFFTKEAEHNPIKTSVIIRVIFIPSPYKNYLIGIFNIGFIPFLVPMALYNILYFGLMVLIGYNIRNFSEIFSRKAWDNKNNIEKFLSIFQYFAMVILIIFMVFLIIFTINNYKKFKNRKENDDSKIKYNCPVLSVSSN